MIKLVHVDLELHGADAVGRDLCRAQSHKGGEAGDGELHCFGRKEKKK